MDFNTLLTTALQDRVSRYNQANVDTASLASALGAQPQNSGVFGALDTGDLLGFGPGEVMDLAKLRSNIGYEKMLTDMGALEFTQKATGQPARDALTNTLVAGQQEEAKQLKLIKEQGRQNSKQDPIRTMVANFVSGLPSEQKTKALARMSEEFMAGSRIKPTDAVQILSDRGAYLRGLASKEYNEGTLSILYPMGTDENLANAAMNILGLKSEDLEIGKDDQKKKDWMTRAKKANPNATPEQLDALWNRKNKKSIGD